MSGWRIVLPAPGTLDRTVTWEVARATAALRMGNRGKREFIQVLRLIEVFFEAIVATAATEAIRLGAISFDAVKLLATAKIVRRPAYLDLSASDQSQEAVPALPRGEACRAPARRPQAGHRNTGAHDDSDAAG